MRTTRNAHYLRPKRWPRRLAFTLVALALLVADVALNEWFWDFSGYMIEGPTFATYLIQWVIDKLLLCAAVIAFMYGWFVTVPARGATDASRGGSGASPSCGGGREQLPSARAAGLERGQERRRVSRALLFALKCAALCSASVVSLVLLFVLPWQSWHYQSLSRRFGPGKSAVITVLSYLLTGVLGLTTALCLAFANRIWRSRRTGETDSALVNASKEDQG